MDPCSFSENILMFVLLSLSVHGLLVTVAASCVCEAIQFVHSFRTELCAIV